MIDRTIGWCTSHRSIVLVVSLAIALWGWWAMHRTPLDAVPDISDVQVIVSTEWTGSQPRPHRGPDHLSDRHGADLDAARADRPRLHRLRHLVRLRHLRGRHRHVLGAQPRRRVPAGHPRTLPDGVQPDDRPGRDRRRLGLPVRPGRRERPSHARRAARAFRTGTCGTALACVRGVAEVASIGGFVKQYQVNLDPNRLAAYDLSPRQRRRSDPARATTTSKDACSSSRAASTWCAAAAI